MTQTGAPPPQQPARRTKTATAWWLLGLSLLLLIVVLVFVLQNLTSASTNFFAFKWTVPLGLDLLLAALFGGVITFLLGGARMLQLRRAARRIAGRSSGPNHGDPRADRRDRIDR